MTGGVGIEPVALATIGFTKTTAEHFFARLRATPTRTLVDVRLNNTSQLAGFAKAGDLAYFLRELCGITYVHQPLLAPTQAMLSSYKKGAVAWPAYADQFLGLMAARRIEEQLRPAELHDSCLLCSEDKPHHCHRRLVVEYLQGKWGVPVAVRHI